VKNKIEESPSYLYESYSQELDSLGKIIKTSQHNLR